MARTNREVYQVFAPAHAFRHGVGWLCSVSSLYILGSWKAVWLDSTESWMQDHRPALTSSSPFWEIFAFYVHAWCSSSWCLHPSWMSIFAIFDISLFNHGRCSEYTPCFLRSPNIGPPNSGHGTGMLSIVCLRRPACLPVRASKRSQVF